MVSVWSQKTMLMIQITGMNVMADVVNFRPMVDNQLIESPFFIQLIKVELDDN